MKKLLARLLLGRKKRYYNIVQMKNELFVISIHPYISAENFINGAVNSGVLTAQGEFVRGGGS